MPEFVVQPVTSRPQLPPQQGCIPADPQESFLQQLSLIESIIRATCRRFRFNEQDAEDFRSAVLLRLIENDYALIRSFRGACQWSTFLTAIIRNQGRDFLVRQRGRWHFSKKARTLGLAAMWLETLCTRDGLHLDEAIEHMTRHRVTRQTRKDLQDLAAELPARTSRRVVGEEHLRNLQDVSSSEQCIHRAEQRMALKRISRALLQAIESLEPQEKRLLGLQYRLGLNLTEVAARLGICRRSVYTLQARCMRRLRRFLEGRGLSRDDIQSALACREDQLSIDLEQLVSGC